MAYPSICITLIVSVIQCLRHCSYDVYVSFAIFPGVLTTGDMPQATNQQASFSRKDLGKT